MRQRSARHPPSPVPSHHHHHIQPFMIQCNHHQRHLNGPWNSPQGWWAQTGGLLGALVGATAGAGVANAVGGAALGSALGVLAHVSTWKDAAAGPNRMFAELATPSDSK